jgi:hypothetical protein
VSDAPSPATFTPYIGGTASLPDGHTLSLVAVDQRTQGGALRAPFSLLMRGAATPVVPEGLHRLQFADGASFELYLIPVHTPSREHQDYQIVFN